MGLVIVDGVEEDGVLFRDMKQGEVGVVLGTVLDGCKGKAVMKGYGDVVMCLADGGIWAGLEENTLRVRILEKGTLRIGEGYD